MRLLKHLNNLWQARTRREQVLALGVGLLLVVMGGYGMVTRALDGLRQLDVQIDQLQDDILNFHYQIARKQSVESHYGVVAAQHSSGWTEPEIQERLRQEIYRLAKKSPPALNDEGIPTTTSSAGGNLVEIPALGQGSLSDGDEDYRQYSISFRVPPVEYSALFAFLERLQGSPQSLRIDGLELIRSPESTAVSANIDLTRIIVAGNLGLGEDGEAAISEGAPLNLVASEWTCESCDLTLGSEHATTGQDALQATASDASARLYLVRGLPAGETYDLGVDITAFGPGTLGLAQDGEGGARFEGAEKLHQEGTPFRYTVRFTVPGKAGEHTPLRLPFVEFEGIGSSIYLDNLTLTRISRS